MAHNKRGMQILMFRLSSWRCWIRHMASHSCHWVRKFGFPVVGEMWDWREKESTWKTSLGTYLIYLGCILSHTRKLFDKIYFKTQSILHTEVLASFRKKHLASSWTQFDTLPQFSVRFNHQGSLVPFCWFRFHLGHGYVSTVAISKKKHIFFFFLV